MYRLLSTWVHNKISPLCYDLLENLSIWTDISVIQTTNWSVYYMPIKIHVFKTLFGTYFANKKVPTYKVNVKTILKIK